MAISASDLISNGVSQFEATIEDLESTVKDLRQEISNHVREIAALLDAIEEFEKVSP